MPDKKVALVNSYPGMGKVDGLLTASKGEGPPPPERVKVTSFFSRMLINVSESYSWCGEFNLEDARKTRRDSANPQIAYRISSRVSETRPLSPICQHNLAGSREFCKEASSKVLRTDSSWNIYKAISRKRSPRNGKKQKEKYRGIWDFERTIFVDLWDR